MTREQRYWLCQFAGWTIQFLLNYGVAVGFGGLSWGYFVSYLLSSVLAMSASHALRQRMKRNAWLDLPPRRMIPRVLAASMLIGVALAAYVGIAAFLIHPQEPLSAFVSLAFSALFGWTLIFVLWSAVYLTWHFFERYRKAEVERLRLEVIAKERQLEALLAQVNPHFLFNCLNSVRALIVEDPAKAQRMVTGLAELLRYALQSGKTATVPLRVEMDAVLTYLRLEQMRFEERLQFAADTPAELMDRHLPPMLIQTLTENAVKHGVSRQVAGGEVRISASEADGVLSVDVVNTGQLLESKESLQLGLRNARERLALLYGTQASLNVRNLDHERVIAEVRLPSEAR